MAWQKLSSIIMLTASCQMVIAVEFYSQSTITVTPDQILEVMPMFSEVECILGCKNYRGCALSSFKKLKQDDRVGNCTFYDNSNSEAQNDEYQVKGNVFAGE